MDLDLGEDQIALRDGIAALLAGRFDPDRVREGFSAEMAAELRDAGVFSLRADGFSWADCVVVFEQLGRACVPGPLVGTLLAGTGRITEIIERADPLWVPHLEQLDELIVLSGDVATLVDPSALDAETSPWPLDPLTPVSRVQSLPAGEPFDLGAGVVRRAGAVLTAALQLGLADRLTEMAVAYAKEREQFDRPIAAFQAIKHLCADMLVRTELARAAVYAAGAHLDESNGVTVDLRGADGLDRAISGAKVLAGEAAVVNGKSATQVHGGMGFTWEVDVHLYLKRAWVLDTRFGSAGEHCDLIAAGLGATATSV